MMMMMMMMNDQMNNGDFRIYIIELYRFEFLKQSFVWYVA